MFYGRFMNVVLWTISLPLGILTNNGTMFFSLAIGHQFAPK